MNTKWLFIVAAFTTFIALLIMILEDVVPSKLYTISTTICSIILYIKWAFEEE